MTSAQVAKKRLRWIVQADRIRLMHEHIRRTGMMWWVPTDLPFN